MDKMKKYLFFLLMAFTLLPMAGFAQDEEAVDYDAYIADLNARCPIDYEGGWMITSFAVKGDTTADVDGQHRKREAYVAQSALAVW